jgi:hypothetical protein
MAIDVSGAQRQRGILLVVGLHVNSPQPRLTKRENAAAAA